MKDVPKYTRPELHDAILDHATAIDAWRTFYASLQETQLRAFGRFGYFLNLHTEVGARRTRVPDWQALSREPGLTSEVRQFGISAGTRFALLTRLRESQRDLLQKLQERRSR